MTVVKKERGSFQLSETALRRLDKIAKRQGVSRAEIVRRAVGVYDWLMGQLDEDKKVLIQDDSGHVATVVWESSMHSDREEPQGDGKDGAGGSDPGGETNAA